MQLVMERLQELASKIEFQCTSGFVAVMCVFYAAASFFPHKVVEGLGLIVANTTGTHFFVWNLVTAGLLETSFLKLVLSVGALVGAGRQLRDGRALFAEEQWWGYALYLLAASAAGGVGTSITKFSIYVLVRDDTLLFSNTHGAAGLLAALAVALKRIDPAWRPAPELLPSLTADGLPGIAVALPAVCALLPLPAPLAPLGDDALFGLFGALAAWFYLRFVHPSPPDGGPGERGEHFSFAYLFPPPARPFVTPLANFVYGVSLLAGLFRERHAADVAAAAAATSALGGAEAISGTAAAVAALLPPHGGAAADEAGGGSAVDPASARRAAKAMKLLDERLAQMATQETDDWLEPDAELGAASGEGGGGGASAA